MFGNYPIINIIIGTMAFVGARADALPKQELVRSPSFVPSGDNPPQCVDLRSQKSTVRLKIRRDLSTMTRKVRQVIENTDYEPNEDNTGQNLSHSLDASQVQTPHDIRLSVLRQTTLSQTGDWLNLKIVLGRGLVFVPGAALTVENKDTSAICTDDGQPVLTQTFKKGDQNSYIVVKVKYDAAHPETSYNIGILVPDDRGEFLTPVFIDPKIKNTG